MDGRSRSSPSCAEIAWIRGAPGPVPQAEGTSSDEELRDQTGPEYDRNVELESIASRLGRTTVEVKDLCKSLGQGPDETLPTFS